MHTESAAVYPHTRTLRVALLANAAFSLSSALVLLCASGTVHRLIQFPDPIVLQALGAGLLLFGLDLTHQGTRARMQSWRALLASIADLLWVLASGALMIWPPAHLSATGHLLIAIIALAVFGFGLGQLYGIHRLHWNPRTQRYRHCLSVAVKVETRDLWPILGDLGSVARFMPSLKSSQLIGAATPGVGAIRECRDLNNRRWQERCTGIEPGHSITLTFMAEASDFPYPASVMEGGWQLLAHADGSMVRVWWELRPRPFWMAVLLLPMLAWQADQRFPVVIGHMANAASGGAAEKSNSSQGAPRLIPHIC